MRKREMLAAIWYGLALVTGVGCVALFYDLRQARYVKKSDTEVALSGISFALGVLLTIGFVGIGYGLT
jgi:hypothetical protein